MHSHSTDIPRKVHRVEILSNTGSAPSSLLPLKSTGGRTPRGDHSPLGGGGGGAGHDGVNKGSILWRDFLNGINRRKRLLRQLKDDAGSVGKAAGTIKQQMLELRQLTLRLVEDALEIEYRGKMKVDNTDFGSVPKLENYDQIEEREDLMALADIISDSDDIFKFPNIRAFLPPDFPKKRNPFLFGKSIDDLVDIIAPPAEPGNIAEELKMLELMRFKRAAKALLRAEAQALNRLPISFSDIESLWIRKERSHELDFIVRAACTMMHNNTTESRTNPVLHFLTDPVLTIEPQEMLLKLNAFGDVIVPVIVETAMRHFLRDCSLTQVVDPVALFLVEWMVAHIGHLGSGEDLSYVKPPSADPSSRLSRPGSQQNRPLSRPLSRPVSVHSRPGSQQGGSILSRSAPSAMQKLEVTWSDMISGLPSALSSGKMGFKSRGSAFDPNDDSSLLQSIEDQEMNSVFSTEGSLSSRVKINKKGAGRNSKKGDDAPHRIPMLQVRKEVEKILKKHGIGRTHSNRDGYLDESLEPETLSALRYELVKLQQELMRRNVLDGKHYIATSVDTLFPQRAIEQTSITLLNRQSDKALIESTGASTGPPTKLSKLNKNNTAEPGEKLIKLIECPGVFFNGEQGVIELCIDTTTDTVIMKMNKFLSDPVGHLESGSKILNRRTVAYARAGNLLVHRITGSTIDRIREAPKGDRAELLEPLMEQLRERMASDPVPRGRITLWADRVLLQRNMTTGGIVTNIIIERDEDCAGIVITCTPIVLSATFSSSSSGAGFQNEAGYGSISLRLSDTELHILLLNQRGLYDLSLRKWESMVSVAQWLSSRVVLTRTDRLDSEVKEEMNRTIDINDADGQLIAVESAHNTSGKNSFNNSLNNSTNNIKDLMKETTRSSDILLTYSPEMIDLTLNRKVDLPREARKQWKSRNLPVVRGMEVKINCVQDLEMLVIQVILSVPAPLLKEKQAKKFIDFNNYDEVEANKEAIELAIIANTKTEPPPIEVTLSYQLTDFEIGVFGSNCTVDKKRVKLGRDSEIEHPATFVWNMLSRLKVAFKGTIEEPYAKNCSVLTPDSWAVKYDRLLLRSVRSITGGIMVVTASAIGRDLLFQADPTSSEIYKEVGSKMMYERDTQELSQSEGWAGDILEVGSRAKLARKIVENLKVIEDQSKYRLEELSYPETRLLTIFLGGDKEQKFDQDLVVGTIEINNFLSLYDLRILIKHELDKRLIPRSYRFMYRGSVCATRQESFRKAWECLPRCALSVVKVGGEGEGKGEKKDGKKDAPNSFIAELVKKNAADEVLEKEAKEAKGLAEGRRRFNPDLVPVPLPTLCKVKEGSADMFVLHNLGMTLKSGDIIRIGDVDCRDYIIGLRSDEMKKFNPRYFPLKPIFSLEAEDESINPRMGNFVYTEYVLDSGLLKAPETLGFTYDLRKDLPVAPTLVVDEILDDGDDFFEVFQPGKRGDSRGGSRGDKRGDSRGDKGDRGDKGSISFKGVMGGIGVSDDTMASRGVSTSVSRARTPKTPGAPKSPESMAPQFSTDEDEEKAEEIEKKGMVLTEVWIWKCISMKDDHRPKWRVQYDEGKIKYNYRYNTPKLRNEVVWNFRVWVQLRQLEIMCTDIRCPGMSAVPYCQRAIEMSTFPSDQYIRILYNIMVTVWYPAKPLDVGIDELKFAKCIRDSKFFPDIRVEERKKQIDKLFQKVYQKRKLPATVHKTLDFASFCLLLQKVALVRYPPPPSAINPRINRMNRNNSISSEKSTSSLMEINLKAHNLINHNNISSSNMNTHNTLNTNTLNNNSNSNINNNINNYNEDSPSRPSSGSTPSPIDLRKRGSKMLSRTMSSYIKLEKIVEKVGEAIDEEKEGEGVGGIGGKHPLKDPRALLNSTVGGSIKLDGRDARKNSIANVRKSSILPARKSSNVNDIRKSSSASTSPIPPMPRRESVIGELRKSSSILQTLRKGSNMIKKGKAHRDSTVSVESAEDDESEMDVIDIKHITYAYNKLVNDFLITCDVFTDAVWEEIKSFTLLKEGRRYCAATRIQARFRIFSWRSKYLTFLKQLIVLQASFRRYIVLKAVRAVRALIDEDYLFRRRYHCATVITATVRMYLKKCWIYKRKQLILLEQIAATKANRFRLSKIRIKERRGLLFIEFRRINGFEVVVKILRRDTRYYSRDYSIIVAVYLRFTQSTSRFEMDEADLRTYVQRFTGLDAVGVGDLLDKRYLRQVIASQLIVRPSRNPLRPPQIIFSKNTVPQQGKKRLVRGRVINGQTFVNTVYEQGGEISVKIYHPLSSTIFLTKLTHQMLEDWYSEMFLKDESLTELERQAPIELFRLERRKDLYKWAVDHLVVDSRRNSYKIVFQCQYEKSRKIESITMIQNTFRGYLCRVRYLQTIFAYTLKVNTSTEGSTYYINCRTGLTTWTKPTNVGRSEVPEPLNKWYSMSYEQQGRWYEQFVNPYSGRFTHLSIDRAVRVIQAVVRNALLRVVFLPLPRLKKVVTIHHNAVAHYDVLGGSTKQLGTVINHAMAMQVINLDEMHCNDIYKHALDLSGSSPLVCRAYAIHLISTCKAPIAVSRDRSLKQLANSLRIDENHSKFETALTLYEYACIRHPTDYRALLNLALVDILIYKNNSRGEKLLRRAVAANPFQDRVLEIWNYLKDSFPDRQLLHYPRSRIELATQKAGDLGGKKRELHGWVVTESPDWAGWCYCSEADNPHLNPLKRNTQKGKPKAKTVNKSLQKDSKSGTGSDPAKFTDWAQLSQALKTNYSIWYNPATGLQQVEEPCFLVEFEIRKRRSLYRESSGSFELYFDPLTNYHFQYHPLTDTYT